MSREEQVDGLVSLLRRELVVARLAVSSSSTLLSDEAAKTASLNALGTAESAIDTLDSVARRRFVSGDPAYPVERLERFAADVHASIAAIYSGVGEWNVSGILGETVRETASDVKAGAVAAANAVGTWFGPVLLVVGVVAAAYIVGKVRK